MDDKEKYKKEQFVHVYLAIMRKKDNDVEDIPAPKRVFRQVIYDDILDLEILKTKCKSLKGTWRIYKTINKRDRYKARDLMIIELIKNPHKDVESLYRTCLLQPECKATNHFLIDIDTKVTGFISEIDLVLKRAGVIILDKAETPNGFHIVTEKFDTRIMKPYIKHLSIPNAKMATEIKKDAYIFKEIFEVS